MITYIKDIVAFGSFGLFAASVMVWADVLIG